MCEFKIIHGRIGSDIWANSRLKIIKDIIKGKNQRILDFGCGPGYMGSIFSKNNHVIFSDMSREGIARLEGDRVLLDARYPSLKEGRFDWVICAGVIEHIVEDKLVLGNIYRLLKKGGKALITIPAFSWLHGKHDTYIGHYRRYDKTAFIRMVKRMGFKVDFIKYTNSLMFPAFLFSNKFLTQTKTYRGKSGLEKRIIPLLDLICRMEKRLRFPFGVGLMLVLKKQVTR